MLKWLYALLFFYTADTARLKRDYYGPNAIEDNSVFLNNNPINAGFTTRWRDEAVTIIFVGRPLHFYELQVDLYVQGMWIYDESCRTSGKCGDITYKDLFDRRTSMTLQNLNYPMTFGSNVIGDYVKDFIGISYFMEYQQNFGLATSVPIVTPAGGVFGLGLNMVGDEPTLIRSLLLHCVQRTVTIFADRSNETRRVGDRAGGSMTIGRKDKLNCKDDAQYVALYNNSAWMVQLERVVIDATYTDYAVPLVAFRPGQPYTLAPKSFTDTFFYKTGAKPIGNGTVWAIDMSAGFNPVKIKFFFPQNVILQLEGMDYVIMANNTQTTSLAYLTIRPNPDSSDPRRPGWVFGDDFMRKFCLILLDEQVPEIGFATNIWDPDVYQNSAAFSEILWCLLLVLLSQCI